MKLIAHRGNTDGPSVFENQPGHIEKAISLGFDVELDVWFIGSNLWAGHDSAQYLLRDSFLDKIKTRTWFHCKNIEALFFIKDKYPDFNYFWHQEDDVTITKSGHFWTYPGKLLSSNSVCVMPETVEYAQAELQVAYAICTDYPSNYSEISSAKTLSA